MRRGRLSLGSFEFVLAGVAAGLAAGLAAGFALFSRVITVDLTLVLGSPPAALFAFAFVLPLSAGLSAFSSAAIAALVSAFSSFRAAAFLLPFPLGVSSPSSAAAIWKLIRVPTRGLRAR